MAKRKQITSETPRKNRKTITIEQSKPPRRRRRWLWWSVGGFIGLVIISAIGQALGIIPTAEEMDMTRTAEAAEQIALLPTANATVVYTATFLPTETSTSTETLTITASTSMTFTAIPTAINSVSVQTSPTPSYTSTVTPSVTITPTLALANTASATAEISDVEVTVFNELLEQIDGVSIDVISVSFDHVYIEAFVNPGYNTLNTAEQMFTESRRLLGQDNFSVILNDGTSATDYFWNVSREQWIITSLDSTLTQIANIQPTATINLPPQTTLYITNGSVNARPCPHLTEECAPAATLAQGTQVQGVIQVSGDSYQNSTVWWQITYNNQTLYIHNAFISLQPISSVNTAPQATAPPPQGAAPGPRPRNCATAVAMGYTPQQAAYWDHLDQDNDGVACYGD